MTSSEPTPSKSKLEIEALRALAHQFFKFGIVGGVGFIIDWTFLHIGMDSLGLSNKTAAFFSFPFAVVSTWVGNRLFTFRDVKHAPFAKQLSKFVAVCAVGLVFNRGTYLILSSYVPLVAAYPVLGLIGGTGVGMFFNFFAARKHVFGDAI